MLILRDTQDGWKTASQDGNFRIRWAVNQYDHELRVAAKSGMDLESRSIPFLIIRRTVTGEQINLEHLPAFCRARVLILGVGNLLFGDDGFGPAVAEHLDKLYAPSDDVYIMDVGTGVRKLLFTLTLR